MAKERAASTAFSGIEAVQESDENKEERELKFRDATLIHFKQKEAFDTVTRERFFRARVKEVFRGSKVRDWTNLGDHWKGVKIVMDTVRDRVGGEEGIMKILETEGEDGVKKIVLDVKEEVSFAIERARKKGSENVVAVE